MFSDVLPLFVYFVPAALIGFRSFTTVRARSTAHALFAALAAVSIVIHYRGANLVEPERYNFSPDNIDFEGRKRLWDYHDIQWMRGLE
jgi:hypothetical protein